MQKSDLRCVITKLLPIIWLVAFVWPVTSWNYARCQYWQTFILHKALRENVIGSACQLKYSCSIFHVVKITRVINYCNQTPEMGGLLVNS